MLSIKKEFVSFQDKLYLLKSTIKEEHKPIIEKWKELLDADVVLRKEGNLYFLELIPDLEIIEYIK